ncbi:hypothetical protein MBLNU457_6066t1 [Dothideomycetes sp. NU457]
MALPSSPGAKTPSYALETNNLTSLVTYNSSPAGLSITSSISLPAGSLFSPITTSTPASAKRWSTVQTGRDTHIELNSALLYMNHSCNPSLEVDVKEMVVRVARGRDLNKGDELTFFYPSTEWDFAGPFRCLCAEEGCLGEVKGARFIEKEQVDRWWFNEHIRELMSERDGE